MGNQDLKEQLEGLFSGLEDPIRAIKLSEPWTVPS